MSVPTTAAKQPATKSVPQPRVASRSGDNRPSTGAATTASTSKVSVASDLAPIMSAPGAAARSRKALLGLRDQLVLDGDAAVLGLGLLDGDLLGGAEGAAERGHLLRRGVVGVGADDDVVGEVGAVLEDLVIGGERAGV